MVRTLPTRVISVAILQNGRINKENIRKRSAKTSEGSLLQYHKRRLVLATGPKVMASRKAFDFRAVCTFSCSWISSAVFTVLALPVSIQVQESEGKI